MEKSRSQSRNRDQEQRRKHEQSAAAPECRAELAVERHAEILDQDAQLRQAQARAAQQQRTARPAGQVAVQQTLARQQQAVRMLGHVAEHAARQQQAQQP